MPIQKSASGIDGLDEILHGGLPAKRPTLVSGGPGSGKTMLGMQFLCHGALQLGEPGLFISFDEEEKDIITNYESTRLKLNQAMERGLIRIEAIPLMHTMTIQTGEFTLDGFMLSLENLTNAIKAKRLVLDSMDAFSTRFGDSENLRYELARICRWTKEKGLTTILTSEVHDNLTSIYSLEEYVADCDIFLDHRVKDQISKRRLRIIKYRGSSHGADEYPFLIGKAGLRVFPITSAGLEGEASHEFVSSGVEGLDSMLDGRGYYKGSAILISGSAGSGTTTLASCLALRSCSMGSRSLYFAFEESTSQIIRNLASVGLDMSKYIDQGLLRLEPIRPSIFGLEEHLLRFHALVDEFKPDTVIVDPITNFLPIASPWK